MPLYDCFLFAGEWPQLDIRLHELEGLVDKFVVVESPYTFQGNEKPLHFRERAHEYGRYPIQVVTATRAPVKGEDPFVAEFAQRDVIYDWLAEAEDRDYVLVSDVDEIPRRQALAYALKEGMPAVAFHQRLFYYYLNWEALDGWWGTRLYRKDRLPRSMRVVRAMGALVANEIPCESGGWHLSWLGGAGAIRTKIQSFSHRELNRPQILGSGHIEECLRSRRTVHSYEPLQVVKIDDTFPRLVREQPGRFAEHVGE